MLFVSDFADQAVMLPLALVVLVGLGILGWWRGAFAWMAAVGGTFAVIVVLKAGFFSLAGTFGSDYALSPSGHVASACVVYGGLAVLLLRGSVPRVLLAAIPVAVVLVIGASRLALGVHTLPEVVIGAMVGAAGLVALAATMGERPAVAGWAVTALGGVTVLALHGLHLPAEQAIQFASRSW